MKYARKAPETKLDLLSQLQSYVKELSRKRDAKAAAKHDEQYKNFLVQLCEEEKAFDAAMKKLRSDLAYAGAEGNRQ